MVTFLRLVLKNAKMIEHKLKEMNRSFSSCCMLWPSIFVNVLKYLKTQIRNVIKAKHHFSYPSYLLVSFGLWKVCPLKLSVLKIYKLIKTFDGTFLNWGKIILDVFFCLGSEKVFIFQSILKSDHFTFPRQLFSV